MIFAWGELLDPPAEIIIYKKNRVFTGATDIDLGESGVSGGIILQQHWNQNV